MRRFARFSDEELTELWRGLTTNDCISYGFEDDDHDVDAELAREMYYESVRRGLNERDPRLWENVV